MRKFDCEAFEKVVIEQGRTIKWVAVKSDRAVDTVRSWLKGRSNPDKAAFKLLCLHMEVDPEQFWIEQDAA